MHCINCECQQNSCSAHCFQSKKRLYNFLKAWHTLWGQYFNLWNDTHNNSFFRSGQALKWNKIILSLQRHKSNYLCEMHKEIIKLHTPSKTTSRWALREFGASCWSLLIAKPHRLDVVTVVYLGGESHSGTLGLPPPVFFPPNQRAFFKSISPLWKPYWKKLVVNKITLKISWWTS